MRVLFVCSEAVPFAKTGGLADVAGALPPALRAATDGEVDVRLMMPLYRGVDRSRLEFVHNPGMAAIVRWKEDPPVPDVDCYFVEHEHFFDRNGLYGDENGDFGDNAYRYGLFCRQILDWLSWEAQNDGWVPDVIHCNDWQTGLLPVMLKTRSYWGGGWLDQVATVMTIHNIAYQGHFSPAVLEGLDLPEWLDQPEFMEYHGALSFLKGGLVFADRISTVSMRYAHEIMTSEYGCGLEGVIRSRMGALHGILNGIDTSVWDPATDRHLSEEERYDLSDLSGKAAAKANLQREFNMAVRPDVPIFGFVGRLASQKGLDLLSQGVSAMMDWGVQVVVLGTGDSRYEQLFMRMEHERPQSMGTYLGFDERLAHRIEAGADFFMMPSLYEPCGLNQMISQRYGTVPVVRRTGGLADSVVDADADVENGTGFLFDDYHVGALLWAAGRALEAYTQPPRMERIVRRGMSLDFSWQASARNYLQLYLEACQVVRGG